MRHSGKVWDQGMKSQLCVGKRLLRFINLVKLWLRLTLAVKWEEWEWENDERNPSKGIIWVIEEQGICDPHG